jgi:hypothetical protein
MEVDAAPNKNVGSTFVLGDVNGPNELKMMHSHNTSANSSGSKLSHRQHFVGALDGARL